ncbi:hypothetical protein [Mesorhizobium sp.]|uniref:hypothetical protein n=1 Tax=Mesorhizobium sp. TaxID=1871066 RepID=UPI000FEA09BD|nr:hypothetical protein [Mesorhizobium sp.]RWK63818.1 MAG: hypothetical protein EOR49_07705 [Mesorhizobium sp.]RWM50868.1 MAG: hypothetical protein EOR76_07310 [Mesorhizobium sp.]RWM57565.1 MAG: hypothetical protein EOR78_09930 [Mesorhizobium sp.]RWM58953.1 MAG: hypothetical protein EOR79_11505 [Mesorhizobium sp.]RWM99760.1 MAG: hypothetical protein EOR85_17580 [Mesorhizobium sp.]
MNDTAYRQLLVGLVALPKIQATPKGLLHGAAITARNDRRFATVAAEITDNADAVLPGRPKELIDRHIKLVSEPFDPFWFSQPDKGFEVKQWALLRKLERDYLNKLK